MISRQLTGIVLAPDGTGILTGKVVATPLMPLPAESSAGVLAPVKQEYEIENGELSGTIVAPSRYKFQIYNGNLLVWQFVRFVSEQPTATTIQDIYLSGIGPIPNVPNVLREGSLITLLSSGVTTSGKILSTVENGALAWSSAGAGDMLTSVYDPDEDGKVIAAETADAVPWDGISSKPSQYPPEAHAHDGEDITSQVASAASADSVQWSGVSGKPSSYPPETHSHQGSDITSQVASAASADAVAWSGVSGKPSAYPPESHASSHASNGSDAITPSAIGAAASSHSHAASEITSGQVASARGGTGVDSSSWTGVPKVTSGTWASGATAADVAAIPLTAAVVSVASSRNIASTDAGKILECSGTITITGDGTLPVGAQVTLVNIGTGTVTLAATTLRSRGGRNKLSQQWSAATMYHRGSGEWVAAGDLST